MNRCRGVCVLCVLLASLGTFVGCRSAALSNALLRVHHLDAQQEESYSASDNRVSEFWQSWAGQDSSTLAAPAQCIPSRCRFTGPGDASVTAKAAYGKAGLYLLFEVIDDAWVGRAHIDDWGADALDFYLDAHDAGTIATCSDCLIGLRSTTLSYTTQQFKIWVGDLQTRAVQYSFWDDDLRTWEVLSLSIDTAESRYGFEAEVVRVDRTTRVLEFFIPWSRLGHRGLPGMPGAGTRLAIVPGYNDSDGDGKGPDCLRWLRGDPWAGDAKTTNYWGSLEIGPARPGR